ncbi:MAG: hypothetical protein FWD46_08940, partial [Cystobacterineae bacterium]|nr:hypothetical protein [Cystobacterineae bacterium]
MRKIRLLWSVCLAMLLASCTNPNKEESALKEPTDHGQKPAKGGEEPEDNGQKPVEEGKEPEDNGQQIESITVIDIRSERAKEYDAKIERARAGEAVDLDGDGHKEFRIWTDERG